MVFNITNLIDLVGAILILMVGINLFVYDRGNKVGQIRFVIKRQSWWFIFKEKMGLGPTYEGCFVVSSKGKPKIIKFKINKKIYLTFVDVFTSGRSIKIFYTKRWFCSMEIYKIQM